MHLCRYCQKDISDLTPSQKSNHVRWCDANPRRTEYTEKLKDARKALEGKQVWNKGLTKDTDIRVKQYAETHAQKIQSGEITPSFKGKTHSVETKEALKLKALNNDYIRVNKKTTPYKKPDGIIVKLDSKWEITVATNLDKVGIEWIRPKPLKWYDAKGFVHNYFADFYIPAWDAYLDPKNDWAEIDQKEKLAYLSKHYKNVFILKKHQLDIDSIKKIVGV